MEIPSVVHLLMLITILYASSLFSSVGEQEIKFTGVKLSTQLEHFAECQKKKNLKKDRKIVEHVESKYKLSWVNEFNTM